MFLIISTTCFGAQQVKPPEDVQAKLEWQPSTPTDANASFEMPGVPKSLERTFSPVPDQVTTVHLNQVDLSPTTSFVFAYNELPAKPLTMQKVNEVLDGGVKGAVARTLGKLTDVKKFTQQNFHAREFTMECIQGEEKTNQVELKVRSRLILVEARLYQLTYVAKKGEFNEADAKKFLESFKYLPPKPTIPEESASKETGSGK